MLPGVHAALSGGSSSWGRRHLPLSPAAQVDGVDSTLAQTSREGSGSATNVNSIPPHNAAVTAAAAAAIGSSHLRRPVYFPPNPYFPSAHGVVGAPKEAIGKGKVAENKNDQHCSALRIVFLEAEVKSAHALNLQLHHHIAYLQAQVGGQLGNIASLHNRIRTLESELASSKGTLEAVKANAAPANSVPASTTPVSAPALASDLGPRFPHEHQPVPNGPAEPGVLGNEGLRDLRPENSSASVSSGTAAEAGPGGISAAPSGSATAAPLAGSPNDQTTPVAPCGDGTRAEPFSAESASSGSDGGPEFGLGVVTEPDIDVNQTPIVATPRKRRTSLKDFWTSSSLAFNDSPPSSNTRNHRRRGELLPHVRELYSLQIPPSRLNYYPCTLDTVPLSQRLKNLVGGLDTTA